jgi:hypothetical protein
MNTTDYNKLFPQGTTDFNGIPIQHRTFISKETVIIYDDAPLKAPDYTTDSFLSDLKFFS